MFSSVACRNVHPMYWGALLGCYLDNKPADEFPRSSNQINFNFTFITQKSGTILLI